MAQNLQKKPSKGILKTSRSIDGQDGTPTASTSKRPKEQRFDEMNIIETFHPANKDYGHMKVDEPKTPYSESVDGDLEPTDELDANILAAKLAASMNKPPRCTEDACSDDDHPDEDEESRQRRLEFEKKRKMHYNEFQALQLARQLMAQEEDEDDDDDDKGEKS